jgi:dTDP-glucose 4,6-dehydratase
VKRVLLTGAGGFVGSHALRHILATTTYEVVCPVTFRHKGLSDRIRLAMDDMPDAAHRVHVVRCDLSTPISVVTDRAFGPIDYVINFASESHVDRSISHPTPFILNNVALICHLLDWARTTSSDIKAIVQISTDEVYGPAHEGYAHGEWEDLHLPSNPYSASKAAQEDIAFSYWRTYGLPIIFTNTMNIIGETQDTEKFVPLVLSKVLDGKEMEIHSDSDGKPGSRFYLHARNQADGVLRVLHHVLSNPFDPNTREALTYNHEAASPYRYHIVGEREVDNLEMALMVAAAAGKILKYRLTDFHSSRPGHDLRYALDGTKMKQIGWAPPVPLDESLKRTIRWTLAHPEWL